MRHRKVFGYGGRIHCWFIARRIRRGKIPGMGPAARP